MSTVSGVGATNDLASSILKSYDKDGNGSLSAQEFTSFLQQLVGDLRQTAKTTTETTAPSAGSLATLFPSATASVPDASAQTRVRAGDMLGFDENKLGNPEHTTFKYQIGRILQYCPATKEGLQQALSEIQKLVPDAQIVGSNGDKIDFGAYVDPKAGKIGVIDVLVGAASGGRGWAWQPMES